jgi:hypoxanthine phosphoribosyltransferase
MAAPSSRVDVLISEAEVHARVQSLADTIAKDIPGDVLIVALLRGSFVFAADLIRALHNAGSRPQVDFMTASSYGTGTESSGTITIHKDLTEDVTGRTILLIDDILESGRTLFYARAEIERRGAKAIHIAVLLEKPGKRKVEITADYVGFSIPDKFVVGYGLDYANYYRELPFIGVITD